MKAIEDYLISLGTWSLPLVFGVVCGVFILGVIVWFGYDYGLKERERRVRRLVKKRDGNHAALDFTIEPATDGAMEIRLTRSAFKRLAKREKVEGIVEGQKAKMIFRIVRV